MRKVNWWWEYIKSRQEKIKDKLTKNEVRKIKDNIASLIKEENILILENGEIEDYLPEGFKNIEKAPELVKAPKLEEFIKEIEKTDLENKIKFILSK
jgi:regulator of replication initiation timing